MATESFAPIRGLGPADLRQCAALSIDRGWLPERSKWSLLLGACQTFGVDAPDGRGLAGAVVLTRWGPDLASVGMMLVAARYARRGLGRALMEHVIAEAGDATVTLFATDLGRPLYEQLGFAPVRRSVSFVGAFRPGPAGASSMYSVPTGLSTLAAADVADPRVTPETVKVTRTRSPSRFMPVIDPTFTPSTVTMSPAASPPALAKSAW